jgi:hypothetical protein
MNFRVYVVENYSQFLTNLLHLKGLGLLLGSPSTIK